MVKRTLQIKDLAAGEQYAVQVRAIGDGEEYNTGNWSLTLNFTTNEDTTAPEPPTITTFECVGAAFRAVWDAPAFDDGGAALEDLKDYKIVWSETSNSSNNFTQYTESTNATLSYATNVEELGGVPDVTVTITARDYGNLESGAATSSLTNLGTDPNWAGLTAVVDDGGQAIRLEWSQPSGSGTGNVNNSDDLKFYEVLRDTNKIATIPFSPGAVTYLDPDPRPGTHTYQIDATDVYGNKTSSLTADATPIYAAAGDDGIAPSAPEAPGGVLANFLIPGAPIDNPDGTAVYIDVSFDAPITDTDAGDYVDNEGFIIRWRVDGTADYFDRFVADTRDDPQTASRLTVARITGLEPDTTYEVSVAAYDTFNNISAFLVDTATTAADTNAPGQPSAPDAANNVQSIIVSHDLTLQAGGNLPSDVVEFKVYASTTSGFTPVDGNANAGGNQVGTMQVITGETAVGQFSLPTTDGGESWYVKVKAVDSAGNVSPASPQFQSQPDLITGSYIQDATIGNAKITDLDADKLNANTAIINNLTIKDDAGSTGSLTVSGQGFLKSDNWDGTDAGNNSTTGWWLGKNGLVINDGTIEAESFAIKETNLVPFEYSTFTNFQRWYQSNVWTTGFSTPPNAEISMDAGWYRYGYQSLVWAASANFDELFFGVNNTDYNVRVLPNERYVYSLYLYNPGGTSVTFRPIYKNDAGVTFQGTNRVVGAGAVERVSFDFTTTAGVDAIELGLENVNGSAATIQIDGVQLENVKADAVGTPSIFTLPVATRISGNNITAGEIESINYDAGVSGWAINFIGDAEFNDLNIRSTAIIGATGGDHIVINGDVGNTNIASSNYVAGPGAGSEGWKIFDDGSVEFNNGNFRGDITGASGTFSGNLSGSTITGGSIDIGSGTFTVDVNGILTATSANIEGDITGGTIAIGATATNSFYVDSIGNIWSGASTYAGGKFKVSNTGSLIAEDVQIGGNISGADIDVGAGGYVHIPGNGAIIIGDPSSFAATYGTTFYSRNDAIHFHAGGSNERDAGYIETRDSSNNFGTLRIVAPNYTVAPETFIEMRGSSTTGGTNHRRLDIQADNGVNLYFTTPLKATDYIDDDYQVSIPHGINTGTGEIRTIGFLTAGTGSSSAPGIRFDAQQNTGMYRPTSGVVGLTANGGATYFEVRGNGSLVGNWGNMQNASWDGATSTSQYLKWRNSDGVVFRFTSSLRHKRDIESLSVEDAYKMLEAAQPSRWIDDTPLGRIKKEVVEHKPEPGAAGPTAKVEREVPHVHRGTGLIAEPLAEALPYLGITNENGQIENFDQDGVQALLIKAVQDLVRRVEELEAQLA